MASWEDGPEYAPVERPTGFAEASAAPLDVAAPPVQSAALAPKERPFFDGPRDPVVPLAALVPPVVDPRDPAAPFDVASSTVTSMDSAWGAAHWSSPPSTPAPQAWPAPVGAPVSSPALAATVGPWGPPTSAPWPAPTEPLPPQSGPVQLPGGYPPPGTPQWFGPGPSAPQPPTAPGRSDARAVADAATPGLIICLALGGFLYFLAPIMLGVAYFLSSRVRVAVEEIRKAFLMALGFLGFFALAGMVLGREWFADWWHFVGYGALVICWALLIAVLVFVHRALQRGQRPPTSTSNWG